MRNDLPVQADATERRRRIAMKASTADSSASGRVWRYFSVVEIRAWPRALLDYLKVCATGQ